MSIFSSLLSKPIHAIEEKIAEAKQDAKQEMSVIIAKLIVLVTIMFLLLLAISLVSIGLALYLNFRLEHPFFGYLIVGGLYVLIAITLYILNKSGAIRGIVNAYSNKIVFGKSAK